MIPIEIFKIKDSLNPVIMKEVFKVKFKVYI